MAVGERRVDGLKVVRYSDAADENASVSGRLEDKREKEARGTCVSGRFLDSSAALGVALWSSQMG